MNKQVCFLIDDDEDDREIFSIAVDEIGVPIEYITAKNGIEALERLSDTSFSPDYIFIDINMPLMNGEECLIRIRELNHLNEVPIFMYTTSVSATHRDTLVAKGARDIIIKPASLGEIVTTLKDYIK